MVFANRLRLILVGAVVLCVSTAACSVIGSDQETAQLNVSTDPSNAGSVDPSSGTFDVGTEVEVTATANEGWKFSEWTGDRSSTENPLTFTIENDVSLTAVFTEISANEYQLTVNTDPSEGGSVDPTGGAYEAGTQVDITATPNEGWSFAEWTGDVNSTDNPVTVTMDSTIELTANFQQNAKAFLDSVEVSDGKNSTYLHFGMQEGAKVGLDEADSDAPPRPPEGGYYAEFLIQDNNLLTDIRPITRERVVWKLSFAPEEGQGPVTLSWDFSETEHVGDLKLVDDPEDPSVEVDMKSETSYEVSSSSVNNLYFIRPGLRYRIRSQAGK